MATNVALGFKQPFEPLRDFQTISTIADIHDLLAVNKDLPVKDYASFADWVNKQPETALRDVTAGHVPVFVDVVMPTGLHVNQGRLTGICIASPERSPICPMAPTVVELGMPDMLGSAFYGLVAPAGVPGPVAERLNAVCLEIVKDEAVEKRLAALGLVTTGSTPASFLDRVKVETERWSSVVKESNIKVEG